ncbi:MAG: thiamine phosphate synthase [Chloroflexi bacterium]|nr:thiamine phosphate synthase [Chloroflexota bacterium]
MFTPAQLLLYAIVDPGLCRGRSPADIALAAAQGGATLVQVRADALSTLDLLRVSQDVVNALRSLNVPVVINDRVDIALAVGAAGVHVGHVGAEDMPPDIVRRLLGEAAVVGVSVATAEEARAALRLGASYVSLGPIFETSSKHDAGPPVGLDWIRSIRAVYPGPLCAIGGITADNAAAVIEAGADGVAVLGAIASAEDPFAAARRLRASLH